MLSAAALNHLSSFSSSYNHEHLLLPFLTSFSNKHRHLAPQTQTQKQTQTSSLLGRGPLRRLSSPAHENTPGPAATTEATNARVPISEYVAERLGFSRINSLVIAKKLKGHRQNSGVKQPTDLILSDKADNVISYLHEFCRFDQPQVKTLILKYPLILTAHVDKTLKPKITLLQDLGFSTSDMAHVLSRNPTLYLDHDLSPAIQALRGIMGSDEDVVSFFKRLSWGSPYQIIKNLIPNVTMLENEYGIPRDKIMKLVNKQPLRLMVKTETLRDRVVKIEDKWGISRDSGVFLRAVHLFCTLSDENINAKCELFRSFGWSDSDIMILIKKHPASFTSSEARIKKFLRFYMNQLGYEPAYLASRPNMFTSSLEDTVMPRHRVLSVLKENELIKADYKLVNYLTLTEDKFFRMFILPYEEKVPKLREVYVGRRQVKPTWTWRHLNDLIMEEKHSLLPNDG